MKAHLVLGPLFVLMIVAGVTCLSWPWPSAPEPPNESSGPVSSGLGQTNFTDPESRIMRRPSKAFDQSYNTQIAVDDAHQIVVAATVSWLRWPACKT